MNVFQLDPRFDNALLPGELLTYPSIGTKSNGRFIGHTSCSSGGHHMTRHGRAG